MYLLDVLEEHAEEAAFLWMLRQRALRSWNYRPKDLADLEERLLAHVDGLLVGEKAAAEILEPYLSGGEEGEAFAAAFVALESGSAERMAHVFEVWEKAEGETLDGIRHALRHTQNADAVSRVRSYLSSDQPRLVATAIDVLSSRRLPDSYDVVHLFADRPALVRAAALEAIGRMNDRPYLQRVESSLSDPNEAVQRAALRAAFILGSEPVLVACRDLVTHRATNADEALHLLGLAGIREDQPLLWDAVYDERLQPYAILALGAHGYADIIPRLLEFAEKMDDLRGVGCAISRITGINLDDEGLEAPIPSGAVREGEEPTQKELEAELSGPTDDPYDGLETPEITKLNDWWHRHRRRFEAHARLRRGQALTLAVLNQLLSAGSMPTSHAAALELARADLSDVRTERFATSALPGLYHRATVPPD